MVFDFGLAMKQVTEAILYGGSLNPPRKAFNPILAFVGSLVVPIMFYFSLLVVFRSQGLLSDYDWATVANGWGAVAGTDIPLAWVASRFAFGHGHPGEQQLASDQPAIGTHTL